MMAQRGNARRSSTTPAITRQLRGRLLMMKKRFDIPAAMDDRENHHVVALDAVRDDVLKHRKTT